MQKNPSPFRLAEDQFMVSYGPFVAFYSSSRKRYVLLIPEQKAMIRLHAGKWIVKMLQIGMLIALYITTTSATCQLLHSPEAHFVRLIIRILSTT